MSTSSIIVVSNALRLNAFARRHQIDSRANASELTPEAVLA
jgi:hypothetical protein